MAYLVVVMVLAGCPSSTAPTPTPEVTTEYKLAVVHGDPSAEAEFAKILDAIQEGGSVCEPEPNRERVGDQIFTSWEQAGKPDTLLEWARSLAAVCS